MKYLRMLRIAIGGFVVLAAGLVFSLFLLWLAYDWWSWLIDWII